ncbi:FG-GAP and VCBS repeat-containing protein [Streptomyces sp. NPDC006385]|uniref:FG-GAP and VCBS repeat-containing protein n=1 Tax=Streptomyces sp. NPDC006385 TaxID=3156761 RepID=UPI0033A7F0F6
MPSRSHRRTRLSRRRRLGLATGVALVAGALVAPAVNAATEATAATPSGKRLHDDFNGDGYPDVAIGAPSTAVGGAPLRGAISVLYGSSSGLSTSRKQVLTWPNRTNEGYYGAQLASADLDGDGYADLLSTAESEKPYLDHGFALVVNWGGPKGLSATPTQLTWSTGYDWGGRFTVGDVDGDKRPDVVMVSDDRPESEAPGRVWHGPFTRTGSPAKKDTFGIGPVEQSSHHSVTAGDVNGDGIADLAVRTSSQEEPDSRAVSLLLGGRDGLTYKGSLKDAQGRIIGGEDARIGDLNKDGYGDIVVGHSNDSYDSDVELPTKGGALAVVYGGTGGVSSTREPVWINQDTAGVPGAGEHGDGLGSGLSIGDTNGDGYLDVATGLPGEDFDGITDAGTVLVLRGSANGLTATGYKSFSQNTSGVPGTAEAQDRFGQETALVDGNGDRKDGLVVGAPAENFTMGSAWVFSATSSGVTAAHSFSFGPATMGLTVTGARFGSPTAD